MHKLTDALTLEVSFEKLDYNLLKKTRTHHAAGIAVNKARDSLNYFRPHQSCQPLPSLLKN